MNGDAKHSGALVSALLLDATRAPLASVRIEPQTAGPGKPDYRCAACGAVIASRADRTVRDDSFEHVFTNPGGYVYRIGCFRKAPGCRERGERTDFFTWFPGYAWSFAVCRACAAHLGWHYAGRTDDFFGLILKNLKSC